MCLIRCFVEYCVEKKQSCSASETCGALEERAGASLGINSQILFTSGKRAHRLLLLNLRD